MRIVSRSNFLGAARGVLQKELHVALTARDPHLTDVHMAERDLADFENGVLHGLLGRKCDREVSCWDFHVRRSLAVQADTDALRLVAVAPEQDRSAALENHTVGKRPCQSDHVQASMY